MRVPRRRPAAWVYSISTAIHACSARPRISARTRSAMKYSRMDSSKPSREGGSTLARCKHEQYQWTRRSANKEFDMRWFRLLLLIGFVGTQLGLSPAWAQNANDGFDPNANGSVAALAVQPGGKVLVRGFF